MIRGKRVCQYEVEQAFRELAGLQLLWGTRGPRPGSPQSGFDLVCGSGIAGTSERFDPFLLINGPGVNAFDDNSGRGCGAQATVVLSTDDTYRVVVNTVRRKGYRDVGRYVLRYESGSRTAPEDDCL